jgi:hypothetical protein
MSAETGAICGRCRPLMTAILGETLGENVERSYVAPRPPIAEGE